MGLNGAAQPRNEQDLSPMEQPPEGSGVSQNSIFLSGCYDLEKLCLGPIAGDSTIAGRHDRESSVG